MFNPLQSFDLLDFARTGEPLRMSVPQDCVRRDKNCAFGENGMHAYAEDHRAGLATFLGLTLALSAIFWWLIISAGSLGAHGGSYVLALMWCPGVSALITRLVFQRN